MKRYTKKRKDHKNVKKCFQLTAKRVKKNIKKAKSQIKCVILQFSVNSRLKYEN